MDIFKDYLQPKIFLDLVAEIKIPESRGSSSISPDPFMLLKFYPSSEIKNFR